MADWTAAEGPIDLAKVDRTVKKEPEYGEKPRYCLLALGRRPTRGSGW
jgi:hypothetical protein